MFLSALKKVFVYNFGSKLSSKERSYSIFSLDFTPYIDIRVDKEMKSKYELKFKIAVP